MSLQLEPPATPVKFAYKYTFRKLSASQAISTAAIANSVEFTAKSEDVWPEEPL